MNTQDMPEVIEDIYTYSLQSMSNNSEISKEKSASIALDIAKKIHERWGGIQVYIPKGDTLKFKKKYDNIKKDFDGKNHRELAFKYQVSLQRIYLILKTK